MERRFSYPLEFKSVGADAEQGIFEGYASTFGNVDLVGDVLVSGAFRKTLAERWPVLLFGHDQSQPVGRWESVAEDAVGLACRGKLNLDVARAREVHSMLREKNVGGLSIGYDVAPGGREKIGNGPAFLKEVDLFEISIVAIPANPKATVTSVKSFGSRDELAGILRESGLAHRAVNKLLDRGWSAFASEDEPDPEIERLALLMAARTRALKGM